MERAELTRLMASLLAIGVLLGAVNALWGRIGLEAFVVDGPSMEPTLMTDDRFLVDRGAYGNGLRTWSAAGPGDVVVAANPVDGAVLVKRVVAIGGQQVEVSNGALRIDGTPVPVDELGACGDRSPRCREFREHLGHTHLVAWTRLEDFGPVSVPEGHVFLLGDRRDRSNDSRNPLVGPIAQERVLGRVVGRYWPWK